MNEGRGNDMVEEVVGTDIYDDEEFEDQTEEVSTMLDSKTSTF